MATDDQIKKQIERDQELARITHYFEPVEDCPLITPYTRFRKIDDAVLRRVWDIRKHDFEKGPVSLRLGPLLKETTALKAYQTQMVGHLMLMRRMICGDSVGLGKTVDVIAAMAHAISKDPSTRVIVLATRSTTWQWHDEIIKFSHLQPAVVSDTYKKTTGTRARFSQLHDFLNGNGKNVLVTKYTSWIGTRRAIEGGFDEDGNAVDGKETISKEIKQLIAELQEYRKGGGKLILVLDECQKFKSTNAQIRVLVMNMCGCANKVWALTATPFTNNLSEFYSILSAIGIRPLGAFGKFKERFCVTNTYSGHKGRVKEQLLGYRHVKEFKAAVRPFFYGRSQRQVKEQLPRLSTHVVPLELSDYQSQLLLEDIPSGKYQLPPTIKVVEGELQIKDKDPDNLLTMMAVYQAVANTPALLNRDDDKIFLNPSLSPKEEALLDLLDETFEGEKVICFTKFKSQIDRLEALTKAGKFTRRKFLRITGDESEKRRNENKKLFQESPDHDVIFINSAGIEGINLQQSAHMICLDLPWSWGNMLQLVGRMIRIMSPHDACTLHILASKGTIDEYVLETLRSKKGLFDKILGSSFSNGVLEEDDTMAFDLTSQLDSTEEDAIAFKALLKAHVKTISAKSFTSGSILAKERAGTRGTSLLDSPKKRKKMTDEEMEQLWNGPRAGSNALNDQVSESSTELEDGVI